MSFLVGEIVDIRLPGRENRSHRNVAPLFYTSRRAIAPASVAPCAPLALRARGCLLLSMIPYFHMDLIMLSMSENRLKSMLKELRFK